MENGKLKTFNDGRQRRLAVVLRTLYGCVTALIRPQPDGTERFVEWYTPKVLPRAPLKGLADVAIYGVQMLNAELELADLAALRNRQI